MTAGYKLRFTVSVSLLILVLNMQFVEFALWRAERIELSLFSIHSYSLHVGTLYEEHRHTVVLQTKGTTHTDACSSRMGCIQP